MCFSPRYCLTVHCVAANAAAAAAARLAMQAHWILQRPDCSSSAQASPTAVAVGSKLEPHLWLCRTTKQR